MSKKEQPRRRSLNDRLDAELASADIITVAGITAEPSPQVTNPQEGGGAPATKQPQDNTPKADGKEPAPLVTKKATTIMPKEVFNALQMYCTVTDTPKHRALYLFIVDGLHAAGQISDDDHKRFRDMAELLTTTYEKK